MSQPVESGRDPGGAQSGWLLPDGSLAVVERARMLRLHAAEPSPAVAAELMAAPPRTRAGRELAVAVWQRHVSWAEAQQLQALLAHAGPGPQPDPDDPKPDGDPLTMSDQEWVADAVAPLLHLSPAAAQWRISRARELAARLPASLAALAAGAFTMQHVDAVRDVTRDHADRAAAAIDRVVAGDGPRASLSAFRRHARRVAHRLDPLDAELRAREARERRGVWLQREPDGMASLHALLPAADAVTAMTAIDRLALRLASSADGRTADQRRADALAQQFRALLADPALPRRQRRRNSIHVTVDLATLVGLAENPAELAGYGPIPASTARELAEHGVWAFLLTDTATGRIVGHAEPRYRPSAKLARTVLAVQPRCVFPGCPRAAEGSDLDHRDPHAAGGPTAQANMAPLCRFHHRLKTHTAWRLARDAATGRLIWVSPTARRYDVEPPEHATIRGGPYPAEHPWAAFPGDWPSAPPEIDPPGCDPGERDTGDDSNTGTGTGDGAGRTAA